MPRHQRPPARAPLVDGNRGFRVLDVVRRKHVDRVAPIIRVWARVQRIRCAGDSEALLESLATRWIGREDERWSTAPDAERIASGILHIYANAKHGGGIANGECRRRDLSPDSQPD